MLASSGEVSGSHPPSHCVPGMAYIPDGKGDALLMSLLTGALNKHYLKTKKDGYPRFNPM